ncbi:unnamed protein product [Microthlaspi erraticum]|uniref:Uncharacterized protein n=1 Tax=Microthlaspi erraticum TaxID=1685480 RepID=A0A6D2KXK0_9BRAS|nr:unnamed protein product [Microthlaspi erraticum]
MGGVQDAMSAVGSVVSGSCDTNMVIGVPIDVDGNRDSDGQQSMDGELHLPKVHEVESRCDQYIIYLWIVTCGRITTCTRLRGHVAVDMIAS